MNETQLLGLYYISPIDAVILLSQSIARIVLNHISHIKQTDKYESFANMSLITCQKNIGRRKKIKIKTLVPMNKSFLPPWQLMAYRPIPPEHLLLSWHPWQRESPGLINYLPCYFCSIHEPGYNCPPLTLNSDKWHLRVQWLETFPNECMTKW